MSTITKEEQAIFWKAVRVGFVLTLLWSAFMLAVAWALMWMLAADWFLWRLMIFAPVAFAWFVGEMSIVALVGVTLDEKLHAMRRGKR